MKSFAFTLLLLSIALPAYGQPVDAKKRFESDLQAYLNVIRENNEDAFLIIGHVTAGRGVDPRSITSSASVGPGGYFIAKCYDREVNIPFRLHGYQPLNVSASGLAAPSPPTARGGGGAFPNERFNQPQPGESQGGGLPNPRRSEVPKASMVNVGNLTMQPLPPAQRVGVMGKIVIEDHPDAPNPRAAGFKMEWKIAYAPMEGRAMVHTLWREENYVLPPFETPVQKDGSFRVQAFTPALYHLTVSARGCQPQGFHVDLSEGSKQLEAIELKVRKTLTNSIGMEFVSIPPGRFVMGGGGEVPDRFVEMPKEFYMGMTEVTELQFSRLGKDQVIPAGGKPVAGVTWEEAVEFCENLSALPEEFTAGRKYRLPTEAEWEYACRAGTLYERYFGHLKGSYDHAHMSLGKLGPIEVAQLKPNPWGLYDVFGNVAEYCQDRFSPDDEQMGRVIKGGSFASAAHLHCLAWMRVSSKDQKQEAKGSLKEISFTGMKPGFRIVVEQQPQ